jgi:hypothetical protein
VSVLDMSTNGCSKQAKQHYAEAGIAPEEVSPKCLIGANPT